MQRSDVASVLAVVLTLFACADQPPGDVPAAGADSPPAAARDSAPPPVPADERAGPAGPDSGWTHAAVEAPGDGGVATLVAVRTARHPGFERVVFDFGAGPLPDHRVAYVDRPQHECGSGNEVRLEGDAWLQLDLQPAMAHDDAGMATIPAAERHTRPALGNLIELRLTCDFEAQVSWVLGLHTPGDFRILRLTHPSRLVLDVRR